MKEKIKKYKNINNNFKQLIYKSLLYPYKTYIFITNSRIRNEKISALINKKQQKQISSYTKENRYPVLFQITKKYFETKNTKYCDLKILSYGCSTGEEVKTLNDYLPGAKITGVDINKWCIKQAKKKYTNNNFTFTNNFDKIENEKFDAIFVLAVLQNTINRTAKNNTVAQKFLFSDFNNEIVKLDKILKTGGLLIIDQTDFNFLDTEISKKYKVLNDKRNLITRNRPIFNNNNIKTNNTFKLNRIYIKTS